MHRSEYKNRHPTLAKTHTQDVALYLESRAKQKRKIVKPGSGIKH